jgi:hypothetical protein
MQTKMITATMILLAVQMAYLAGAYSHIVYSFKMVRGSVFHCSLVLISYLFEMQLFDRRVQSSFCSLVSAIRRE